ncbi:MAG TPA: DMT family transporter [Alphaproteobacteria bacterium]|nr:DMT family transporter [Alphaproteobacteria bacterium]
MPSRAMPALFVLLWSTGFIGAKFGLPYAEPLTFLFWRFLIALALLVPLALALRAAWPSSWRLAGHIAVSGLLVHAVYLGGVFAAIGQGLPAGVTALVAGLQPLLTAVLAPRLLGERVSGRQWLGLSLGFLGVALVVGEKLLASGAALAFGPGALALAVLALLGIALGTLYQKRYCTGMDLRSGTAIQYLAAAAGTGLFAALLETGEIRWSWQFAGAMAWLVLVLSIAAIMLLMALIRRGEAARVASLFYLVPPVTAVEAWLLFGERLGPLALAGMAVAAGGVALAIRPAPPR